MSQDCKAKASEYSITVINNCLPYIYILLLFTDLIKGDERDFHIIVLIRYEFPRIDGIIYNNLHFHCFIPGYLYFICIKKKKRS